MNTEPNTELRRRWQPAVIAVLLLILAGCGYVTETSLLAPLAGQPFPGDWAFRQEITVTNTGAPLSDYSIRLRVDSSQTDFWNGIENDGRSIHFTGPDGTTPLPFFLDYFDYGGQTAILHVRVASLPTGDTTLYLYFGDSSASSESNASAVFAFYDDFEDGDVSDWTDIPPGEVQFALDGSNGVLLKTSDSDPTGGYVTLPAALSGFEGIWRTNRINENGGAANRYALENAGENGYGPIISNFGGSESFEIEERSGGAGSTLTSDGSPPNLSQNTWYIVVFRRSGDTMDLDLYDESWALIDSVPSATDATVGSFTRFVVRGGHDFWTDDIRIREYVSPDPTTTFGAVENL